MEPWKYAIAAMLGPLIWATTLALILWITRRTFPRAERILFGPAFYSIGWLAGQAVRLALLPLRSVAALARAKRS